MAGRRHALPDYLTRGLTAIFVGTAAGETSARRGHYYAGPGNEFWSLLARSRLIGVSLGPERDAEILAHGFGLTDIAKHRSGNDDVLGDADFDVPAFVRKVRRDQPAWVAFTSKGAAQIASKALGHGRAVSLAGSPGRSMTARCTCCRAHRARTATRPFWRARRASWTGIGPFDERSIEAPIIQHRGTRDLPSRGLNRKI